MAVFRVERTRDYTVMSNYHLKDTGLTLKAKGLLSMMLSLPDEWNYTTRGLASICKESVETIGKTLRELESAGYLTRRQLRARMAGSPIPSTPSLRSRSSPSRNRPRQIRLHQVRKTRIW